MGDNADARTAINAGCGRFRRKVTSKSPLVVTSSRLRYQGLRGLTRSFSFDLPVKRSQVHLTSFAVNGLASCQVMPWRSGNVSSVPSSFHAHPVARSGTIELRLFCGTCSSNKTRLLKTALTGRVATGVASSWIDMLAGLSIMYCRKIPPCFCANTGAALDIAISTPPATAKAWNFSIITRSLPLIFLPLARSFGISVRDRARRARSIFPLDRLPRVSGKRLVVEPDVFHTRAVGDAVDHYREPLGPGLPAGCTAVVKDYWPGPILGQFALYFPHQLLALFLIGLDGLLIDQPVDLRIAVTVIVQLAAARVIQIEVLVGVWSAPHRAEPNDEVLAHDFGQPVGGVDRFELAVDVDFLQLVDHDHRRIPEERQVAHRQLHLEASIGPVAEVLHDPAGFCAVFRDIRIIARQGFQDLRRQAPKPFRWRLHDAADVALPLGDDVDKRRAVEAQPHCTPQIGVVEGRLVPVGDQATIDADRRQLADCLRHLAGHVLQQRRRHAIPEGHVEFTGDESQYRRRQVANDRILDAIEIRPALFPVIGVPRHLDVLVRLELDEFERARADRMLAHVARRNVAGVNPGITGGQYHKKGRLRPLQMKGDLEVALCGDLCEVPVPPLARVDTELLARNPGQHVPGAFDIAGRERLAIVPPDAFAQRERQFRPIFVP